MNDIWYLIVQTNTFNFIIVFILLCVIFSKLNMREKIDKLRNDIKNYVDSSSEEKINAEKALNEIKNEISKLPDEINKIKKSAQNSVSSLERKIESEIKEQMSDIDNNAKRILNLETKKFKSKLTGILSEASVNLAKDNALSQLNNNRKLHDQYIYDAIKEIDGLNL